MEYNNKIFIVGLFFWLIFIFYLFIFLLEKSSTALFCCYYYYILFLIIIIIFFNYFFFTICCSGNIFKVDKKKYERGKALLINWLWFTIKGCILYMSFFSFYILMFYDHEILSESSLCISVKLYCSKTVILLIDC